MLGVDDRLITPATIKWVKVGLVAGLATIPTTILLYYVLGMAVDAAWQGSNMLRQWFWVLCGLVLLKATLAWFFRTGQFRASSEAKLTVRDQIYRQVVRLGPGLLGWPGWAYPECARTIPAATRPRLPCRSKRAKG